MLTERAVRGPPASALTSAPSQPLSELLVPQGRLEPPNQQDELLSMDTADEDLYGHLRDNVPLNECPQQLDDDINVSQLLLGTGSYSSVCLAHRTLVEDQEAHGMVAVKIFKAEGLSPEQILANVQKEGQLQSKCSRIKTGQGSEPFPHVPRVYGWKQLGSTYGLVMESCCCSLRVAMPRPDAPRYGAGCIPPPPTAGRRWFATTLRHHTGLARLPTRLQILRGVAAAVKHLHDHCAVLHNDLRADNVLLDVRKGQLVVKVSDFGLAEELQAGADTRIVKPTNALWIAPEVHWGRAEGPYPVNTSTDVFALGHVMWEVLSGLEPYERIPGKDKMCPKALKDAFQACQLSTDNGKIIVPMRLPDQLPLHCPELGPLYPEELKTLFDSCCSFPPAVDPVSGSSLFSGQQQGRPTAHQLHEALGQVGAAAKAAAEAAAVVAAAVVAAAAAAEAAAEAEAAAAQAEAEADAAAAEAEAAAAAEAEAAAAATGRAPPAAAAAAVGSAAAVVAEAPSPSAVAAAASPLIPAAAAAAAVERASQAAAAAVSSPAAHVADPPSPVAVAAAAAAGSAASPLTPAAAADGSAAASAS